MLLRCCRLLPIFRCCRYAGDAMLLLYAMPCCHLPPAMLAAFMICLLRHADTASRRQPCCALRCHVDAAADVCAAILLSCHAIAAASGDALRLMLPLLRCYAARRCCHTLSTPCAMPYALRLRCHAAMLALIIVARYAAASPYASRCHAAACYMRHVDALRCFYALRCCWRRMHYRIARCAIWRLRLLLLIGAPPCYDVADATPLRAAIC